jgi:hypothetical protein
MFAETYANNRNMQLSDLQLSDINCVVYLKLVSINAKYLPDVCQLKPIGMAVFRPLNDILNQEQQIRF